MASPGIRFGEGETANKISNGVTKIRGRDFQQKFTQQRLIKQFQKFLNFLNCFRKF